MPEYRVLWLLAIVLPLMLGLPGIHHRMRPAAMRLAPWAALPALALLATPGDAVEVPWLLLGMRLGIDTTAKVFLLFTALLWTCAGVYARAYLAEAAEPHHFFTFLLVAMSGNLGAILAQDIASFYLFFALMSFASYSLVVHDGTDEAEHAGKVYLGLVVMGEVLLISALLLTAAAIGSLDLQHVPAGVASASRRDLILGLTLAGFGIKVGALPLHVWRPLAHPVAPTPASAVLSGTMIKVGLLGWLRFLPLGEVALPAWGSLCMVGGLIAAFYGVGVGLTQANPKTVLAYSSISQMGFMTLAVGIGLVVPEAWPLALSAVLLYALHHALAKGALFLGVGVAQGVGRDRWQAVLITMGLLWPALALAGAPLTSGAAAKSTLKTATALLPAPWPDWLSGLLPLAAVGTTLLMGRFLFLTWPAPKTEESHLKPGLWLPWATLVVGVATIPWLFVPEDPAMRQTVSVAALWPVMIGALVMYATWRWQRKPLSKAGLQIPAGDILMVIGWLTEYAQGYWRTHVAVGLARWSAYIPRWRYRRTVTALLATVAYAEAQLGRWISAGILFLLLAAAFFIVLATI